MTRDTVDVQGINLEHVVGVVTSVKHDGQELVCSVKLLKTRSENPDIKGLLTICCPGHLSEPDEKMESELLEISYFRM